jgi:glycine/D-amino acid oxidase-like deaminating enzyme
MKVYGAGIFGVTAALELRRRGHDVILIDRFSEGGPLPHPLAASTDISKAVRLEYGADELYTEMGERALDGWRRWNRDLGPLYHETGVLFLRKSSMAAGTFEGDSYDLLTRRGHHPERLNSAQISARFPAWRGHVDGTFNPAGGFVESGRVVERLLQAAQAEGVSLQAGTLETLGGEPAVVAVGSWTPHVLPSTAGWFRSSGMPVFHLRPEDPSLFTADRFPVFGADISSTGWYGFPLHEGVVKIANHGVGRQLHPSSPERAVTAGEIAALRAFLDETFPALAQAPLAHTRVCVYCDTWDGHFWIAPDPDRPHLVLATGGSGHAFKFAPLLGGLIADAVERVVHPRFRWRPEVRPPRSDEAARHQL